MNTRITARKATTLTEVEYKRLRRLTLGKNGLMRDVLEDLYWGNLVVPHRLYFVRNVETKEIMAWAMVFRYTESARDIAYFYVPTKYRRNGIASRLMKQVLKDYPKVKVEAWEKRSYHFFRKFKVRIDSFSAYGDNYEGIVYRPKKAKA